MTETASVIHGYVPTIYSDGYTVPEIFFSHSFEWSHLSVSSNVLYEVTTFSFSKNCSSLTQKWIFCFCSFHMLLVIRLLGTDLETTVSISFLISEFGGYVGSRFVCAHNHSKISSPHPCCGPCTRTTWFSESWDSMTFPKFQDDLEKEMIGKFLNGIAGLSKFWILNYENCNSI